MFSFGDLHSDVLQRIVNEIPLQSFVNFKQTCKIHNKLPWNKYFCSHFDNSIKFPKINRNFMMKHGQYLLNIENPNIKDWIRFKKSLNKIMNYCYEKRTKYGRKNRYTRIRFVSIITIENDDIGPTEISYNNDINIDHLQGKIYTKIKTPILSQYKIKTHRIESKVHNDTKNLLKLIKSFILTIRNIKSVEIERQPNHYTESDYRAFY